jgi:hypothetical protein
MDTAAKIPMPQRINPRMLIFTGVLLLLIGYPVYLFVDQKLHGGMWDVSDERGRYKMVDLKTLSGFEMDQLRGVNDDIPREFRALDGQRVMLVGEMWSGRSAGGAQRDFDLVYSIAKCCFSGPPKVQHFIRSKAIPGKKLEFLSGMVKVIGKLHVGVENEGGTILSVYRMDVESVEEFR